MNVVIKPFVFVTAIAEDLPNLNSALSIQPKIFVAVISTGEPATPDREIADTLLNVSNIVSSTGDTLIKFVERTYADTLRIVTKTQSATADTVIRTPHVLKYVIAPATLHTLKAPLRNNPVSLINSFKDFGITSISASLNEKTLSDKLSLDTVRNIAVDINDLVLFQLLDYEFKILVEEIDENNGVLTLNGMYDTDKLLYSQIFYSPITVGDNDKNLISASGYIAQIADYFGLSKNIKIQNFTPYHDFTGSNITYSDLLTTVFGWTSRLPQRQINIFIRGNILHCIQRGMEDSTFDITDLPHSRPVKNKKLIRSFWNNPSADNENEYEDKLFSGTISYYTFNSNVSITYSEGLLISENSRLQDGYKYTSAGLKSVSTNNKKYSYTSINGEKYLSRQSVTNNSENYEDGTKVTETITTDYFYKNAADEGDLYLFMETEQNLKKEYQQKDGIWEFSDSETTIRKTTHLPVGNGWYVQNVFVDGKFQGSNLSQGKPGNSISPYTVQQANKAFGRKKIKDKAPETYEEQRQRLAPIADISFPVRELRLIQQLTSDLLWLNRKIQETVSVDLLSRVENGVPEINHVVDFTERIILDGNEYFLVSNQIRFTPRKFIQKLNLIRWYSQ